MRVWKSELLWILLPPLAGLGVGFAFAQPAWGLAGGALLALTWQFLSLARLLRVVGGKRRGSPSGGLAGEIASIWEHRRRKDAARRNELMRLRRDLNESTRAMPDATVVIDRAGTIQWANEAACRWLGLTMPSDLGRPLKQIVRDPTLVKRLEAGTRDGEIELASPAQPEIELLVNLVPYGDGRTLLVARDVSRLKRLERMRRDFVANVSHELRSPLTVVSGYLELLDADPKGPPAWKGPLGETRRQVARMIAIVRDLLELARLESDASAPPRTAIDMGNLIERVRSQIVAGGIGKRRIEVSLASRSRLLGAETEVESAVGNLVSNAVKYTVEDGHIDVEWRDVPSGAELGVADDGIGIPPQEIPRLTERFYRVDKARSARSGGTGLGLAIVKHVAERHGAELKIDSHLGAGSRFTILFPAARVETAAAQDKQSVTA